MDNLASAVNKFILDPKNAGVLALLKGARNGAMYGAKVRFPHALVMVFLFRSGTIREKIRLVLKATRQHARNLALFAFIYKTIMFTSRNLQPLSPTKEASHETFLAGLIAGYIVFGRGVQSSVSQQIVIYVFGRVMLGLAKLAVQSDAVVSKEVGDKLRANGWPIFAAMSWASVMWLFRWYPETLQPSLRSSMVYIYTNADRWDSVRNFLIHNT